jgi:hypothetical protein
LLLASGLAGSLRGALKEADKTVVQNLFLTPTMALTIAASFQKFNEWSYTEYGPLVGSVASDDALVAGSAALLVSHPSDAEQPDEKLISSQDLNVGQTLLQRQAATYIVSLED